GEVDAARLRALHEPCPHLWVAEDEERRRAQLLRYARRVGGVINAREHGEVAGRERRVEGADGLREVARAANADEPVVLRGGDDDKERDEDRVHEMLLRGAGPASIGRDRP